MSFLRPPIDSVTPCFLLISRWPTTYGTIGELPLREAFFNPQAIVNKPEMVNQLLGGFMTHRAQEIDTMLVDDVRNFLFGPPGHGGLDLASLNIQRGRDHGLPSYNAVRMAYGLTKKTSFQEVSTDPEVQKKLSQAYGTNSTPDDMDVWVGGLAEDHIEGGSVGETVATILRDQFRRLRDGDPFFYKKDPDFEHPMMKKIINIESWTLANVIHRNTNMKLAKKHKNVMFVSLKSGDSGD